MERDPIAAQQISFIVPEDAPQKGTFLSDVLQEATAEVRIIAVPDLSEKTIPLALAPTLNETVPVPQPRSLLHKVGLHMAGVAAIGIAFSGGLVLPGTTSANDQRTPAAEQFPDQPFPEAQAAAVPVSAEALNTVDFLLAQPENPHLTYLDRNIADRIKLATGSNKASDQRVVESIKDEEEFKVRQEAAEKLDLHVFDPTATKKLLRENLDPEMPGVLPPKQYIAVANKFLAKEKVQLAVDPKVAYVNSKRYARTNTLNTRQSREFVLAFVDNIANQPKEYADTLGIKRYLLVEPVPKAEQDAAAYIFPDFTGPEGAAVVVDVTAMSGSFTNDAVNHEQGHRTDYLDEGGGSDTDPGFEAAATEVPYGKIGKKPAEGKPDNRPLAAEKAGYFTLDTYQREKQKASRKISNYYGKPDCLAVATKLEKRLDAIGEKTVLTTVYAGQTDVNERKAEGMRDIPQGDNYPRELNIQTPRIRDQFRYLLANLYEYRPRLVRYFIDMSRRPNPRSNPYENNPRFMSENCAYIAAHPNETHGK